MGCTFTGRSICLQRFVLFGSMFGDGGLDEGEMFMFGSIHQMLNK